MTRDRTKNSFKMQMTAGKAYDIKIEYSQDGGGAVANLGWMYPGALDKYKKELEIK